MPSTLLYPRYVGDLGLPHNPRDPQPHRHTHSPIYISQGGDRDQESSVPHNHLCVPLTPASFLRWCYSWCPTGKGLPLSARFTPFGRHFSLCFVRGWPVQIGAIVREGSDLFLPQGVPWALSGGHSPGLGEGKGLDQPCWL